jgi:hypothetical protein
LKQEVSLKLEAGGELEAGGSCWRRTGGEIKREKKINKTKGKKLFRPDYIYRPKQAEILAEVEHRGASYRFACRYEIFRPFRPERNGLYNIVLNLSLSLSRLLFVIYNTVAVLRDKNGTWGFRLEGCLCCCLWNFGFELLH